MLPYRAPHIELAPHIEPAPWSLLRCASRGTPVAALPEYLSARIIICQRSAKPGFGAIFAVFRSELLEASPPPMVVYSERGRKGAFQACMGHGGGRCPPTKVIQRRMLAGQGFSANYQPAGPDFYLFWVIFSGFQPRTPVKWLELGQTKARNGFGTLKIGGYHVVRPWNPLLLTQRPPCRARW